MESIQPQQQIVVPKIALQLRPPADQPQVQAAFRKGALNNFKSIGSMP